MISTVKIDTPYLFPLASSCYFRWASSVCLVDAVFRKDFTPKNYTPLGTLPSLRTPSVEVTNEHMTLLEKSYNL
jgi:hypothetical protein